jgi:tRNA(Ile)-lysidine synthase
MHLAADWRARRGGAAPQMSVLTVDHGLRAGSAGEARLVAGWARARSLAHAVLTWRGDKPETGIQAAARAARYDLMSAWCVDAGADVLLVGHTLDDQAETVLMRLARGSGLDGLAGMARATVWKGTAVERPLLDTSRAELRAWLETRRLPWIDDPSNADPRFERVRLRNAMPELARLGITAQSLARSAARLQRARAALEAATDAAMACCVTVDAAGWCVLDETGFAQAAEDVRLRLLARCLQAVGGGERAPPASALERLAGAMAQAGFHARTLGGCRISRHGAAFAIVREAGRMAPEPLRLEAGRTRVWDGRFHVAWRPGAIRPDAAASLEVRPLGAAGRELMCDQCAQYGQDVRDGLASFWSGDQLIAVPHLGFRSGEYGREAEFAAEFCNLALLRGAGGAAERHRGLR